MPSDRLASVATHQQLQQPPHPALDRLVLVVNGHQSPCPYVKGPTRLHQRTKDKGGKGGRADAVLCRSSAGTIETRDPHHNAPTPLLPSIPKQMDTSLPAMRDTVWEEAVGRLDTALQRPKRQGRTEKEQRRKRGEGEKQWFQKKKKKQTRMPFCT